MREQLKQLWHDFCVSGRDSVKDYAEYTDFSAEELESLLEVASEIYMNDLARQ